MKIKKRNGFTLVELIIVIAVIAILTAVLIPTFAGVIRKANISRGTSEAASMTTALNLYLADKGEKSLMLNGEVSDELVMRAVRENFPEASFEPDSMYAKGYKFVYNHAARKIEYLDMTKAAAVREINDTTAQFPANVLYDGFTLLADYTGGKYPEARVLTEFRAAYFKNFTAAANADMYNTFFEAMDMAAAVGSAECRALVSYNAGRAYLYIDDTSETARTAVGGASQTVLFPADSGREYKIQDNLLSDCTGSVYIPSNVESGSVVNALNNASETATVVYESGASTTHTLNISYTLNEFGAVSFNAGVYTYPAGSAIKFFIRVDEGFGYEITGTDHTQNDSYVLVVDADLSIEIIFERQELSLEAYSDLSADYNPTFTYAADTGAASYSYSEPEGVIFKRLFMGWYYDGKFLTDQTTPVLTFTNSSVTAGEKTVNFEKITARRGVIRLEVRFGYQITAQNFAAFVDIVDGGHTTVDKVFVLNEDIDLTGVDFAPIGKEYVFNGIFDGAEHKISGIDFTAAPGDVYVGFFAQIGVLGGVKNLTLENCKFTGGADALFGGIAAKSVRAGMADAVSNCVLAGVTYNGSATDVIVGDYVD